MAAVNEAVDVELERQAAVKLNETRAVDLLDSRFGDLLFDDNYSIELLLKLADENNLNLNELREKLIKHQQDLNQTSLELFNNSYDRFYKLSHIIACLAEPIQHVISPLQNYRNRLGQLCDNHDSYINEIDRKISCLEETSRNKLLASRLIAAIRRRDRIFHQIQRIEWLKRPSAETIINEPVDDIEHKVNCDSIERIVVELSHLLCEICAIQPTSDQLIPIKKTLETSVLEQQLRLGSWFYDVFREAIQAENRPILEFIMRTYQQSGDYRELDRVWREVVVRPYFNILLGPDKQNLPTIANSAQLGQTYQLMRQFLSKHIELIGADFVVRSFWVEVIEALDKVSVIYSIDSIDSFKDRYLQTQAFLTEHQTRAGATCNKDGATLEEKKAAGIERIMSKFDLNSYFKQKSSEIEAGIEFSLSQQPLSELPSDGDNLNLGGASELTQLNNSFRLRVCANIYALIAKCWSPEIYIEALDEQFTQLICSILRKFAEWLSKLRLSDFRIIGSSARDNNNRTTNFLAKQDAIMRLLCDDCMKLLDLLPQLELNSLPNSAQQLIASSRRDSIKLSFETVKSGLNNVRNLQQLLER